MTLLRFGPAALFPLFLLVAFPLRAQIDLRQDATTSTVEKYRRFIEAEAPSEDAFIAMQRVAAIYLRQKRWTDAVGVYKRFRRFFPEDKRIGKIIAMLEQQTDSVAISNIGPAVNSSSGESRPVLTPNRQMLYFSAQRRSDGAGGSDIYRSFIQEGIPQKAENLGPAFNTNVNESPLSISNDGRRFYVFGNYEGTFGHGDIFLYSPSENGWGNRQHLDSGINSPHFDSDASESASGDALLFVSDRPGGIGAYHEKDRPFHGDIWGNTDIYVAVRSGDGWKKPVNLGPKINTPYAERSPWLAPDGRTLYFSSDGHYGLGLLDLFVTRRLRADSWTEWSEPVNLGRVINSADDDMDFRLTGNGSEGVFGSYNRDEGYGGGDIFTVDRITPAPVTAAVPVRLNGILFDYDRAEVAPQANPVIDQLAAMLKANPDARIEILGHTDSIGGDAYNRRLSLRRARAVVNMLVSAGVPRRQLTARGHGRQLPVATNETEEGRSLNRRVEFRLLSQGGI